MPNKGQAGLLLEEIDTKFLLMDDIGQKGNNWRPTLGIMLSISAGALIYVGATHLLPAVEKENKKYSLVSLAAGILIAVIIVSTK